MEREKIILEFLPLPSDVPAPARVRALLKRALRSLSLRCTKVIGLPDSWDEHPGAEPRRDCR